MFNASMLSMEEEMQQFSENFAIEMHLIKTYMYIAHLEDLKKKAAFLREQGGAQNKSVN